MNRDETTLNANFNSHFIRNAEGMFNDFFIYQTTEYSSKLT